MVALAVVIIVSILVILIFKIQGYSENISIENRKIIDEEKKLDLCVKKFGTQHELWAKHGIFVLKINSEYMRYGVLLPKYWTKISIISATDYPKIKCHVHDQE